MGWGGLNKGNPKARHTCASRVNESFDLDLDPGIYGLEPSHPLTLSSKSTMSSGATPSCSETISSSMLWCLDEVVAGNALAGTVFGAAAGSAAAAAGASRPSCRGHLSAFQLRQLTGVISLRKFRSSIWVTIQPPEMATQEVSVARSCRREHPTPTCIPRPSPEPLPAPWQLWPRLGRSWFVGWA